MTADVLCVLIQKQSNRVSMGYRLQWIETSQFHLFRFIALLMLSENKRWQEMNQKTIHIMLKSQIYSLKPALTWVTLRIIHLDSWPSGQLRFSLDVYAGC